MADHLSLGFPCKIPLEPLEMMGTFGDVFPHSVAGSWVHDLNIPVVSPFRYGWRSPPWIAPFVACNLFLYWIGDLRRCLLTLVVDLLVCDFRIPVVPFYHPCPDLCSLYHAFSCDKLFVPHTMLFYLYVGSEGDHRQRSLNLMTDLQAEHLRIPVVFSVEFFSKRLTSSALCVILAAPPP